MARYKDGQFVVNDSTLIGDEDKKPGEHVIHAGIYRCMGCGREIVITEKKELPPQNHHQHAPDDGAIRWRLIVLADHRTDAERAREHERQEGRM